MDEFTPICQIKDLLLGGSTTCRQESLEPSIFLRGVQRQSNGHSGVQASPNIQNYTLVRQNRRLGPGGGLLIFIHNSVNFIHKPLSTTSKNDPHLEELTISIAMDNTELLITNVCIPPASSCNGCYSLSLDHMLTFTSAGILQCSPFTLAFRNNRYERQPTGGFNKQIQLCSPKHIFNPGNSDPSSPDVSLPSASLITSSEWHTHDHELRPSAHPYRITDN